MPELENRIVAHHVGGRGFGVALNCPPRLDKDLVHILYEADEVCARGMSDENKRDNFHILPYCLGKRDGPGKIFITRNAYASSNYEPSSEYSKYYCELHLDGEVDGVMLQNAVYDVVYGHDYSVVEVRDVHVRTLDGIMKADNGLACLSPDFLSLDTQGSELDILEGGLRTFSDHCLALATEIEFHPMYKDQSLFSDIFDFALRHGFHFVGFTYLQEISPNRLPLGARAKGILGFGDALFFRSIASVQSIARSQNELYLMLLKLAFIALNFGHLEFALQVVDSADEAKPDPAFRNRVFARDCYRLLYELKKAVGELPASFPHFDRSKMVAERKAVIDRRQPQPVQVEPPTPPSPPPATGEPAAPGSGPASSPSDSQPEARSQRIRYLLLTNPPAAIAKLVRHFRGPPPQAAAALAAPTALAPAVGTAPPTPLPVQEASETPVVPTPAPSAHTTSVEAVLESYGYIWWADVVRQRRKSAEHCVPGRMY
jgi:FkbM family methyltransferase